MIYPFKYRIGQAKRKRVIRVVNHATATIKSSPHVIPRYSTPYTWHHVTWWSIDQRGRRGEHCWRMEDKVDIESWMTMLLYCFKVWSVD
jgi:hypothetical protein